MTHPRPDPPDLEPAGTDVLAAMAGHLRDERPVPRATFRRDLRSLLGPGLCRTRT